ncbi:hypothetical protein RMSM_01266, partial [Rhodopirellula maiorica SM1]
QVVGFARIPLFAVETPGTLASPTTKVDGIGLASQRNAVKHLFVAKLAESFGITRVAESLCDLRYS